MSIGKGKRPSGQKRDNRRSLVTVTNREFQQRMPGSVLLPLPAPFTCSL